MNLRVIENGLEFMSALRFWAYICFFTVILAGARVYAQDVERSRELWRSDMAVINVREPGGQFVTAPALEVLNQCRELLTSHIGPEAVESYIFTTDGINGMDTAWAIHSSYLSSIYAESRDGEASAVNLMGEYLCGRRYGEWALALPGSNGIPAWVDDH